MDAQPLAGRVYMDDDATDSLSDLVPKSPPSARWFGPRLSGVSAVTVAPSSRDDVTAVPFHPQLSVSAPTACEPPCPVGEDGDAAGDVDWSALPEALLDVVLRMLDSLAPEWPDRRALVAACSVCRAWRRVGRHVLAPLHWTPGASAGDWASPARLLVPGPVTEHVKCFIQRERVKNSLKRRYLLFLGSADGFHRGKFLLCATRQPGAALCSTYDISTSTGGDPGCVVAQLRSNFFGTQFHIIQRDSATAACAASLLSPEQAAMVAALPGWGAPPPPSWASDGGSRAASPPGSPQAGGLSPMAGDCDEDMDALEADPMQLDDHFSERPASPAAVAPTTGGVPPSSGSTVVGALSYDCNIWSHRGPRRMAVALSNPLMDTLLAANADAASVQHSAEHGAVVAPPVVEERAAPVAAASMAIGGDQEPSVPVLVPPAGADHEAGDALLASHVSSPGEFAVLRNKAPRWHETYQCWCLDFGGRVTTASVKNFQLTAGGQGRVLMQFGRTSHKDVFVMDYQHPLSAVQAFAVALSAFDSKLACR